MGAGSVGPRECSPPPAAAWSERRTTVNTMRRRKYLIGIGSLAAGSAVAVGTGAVTQSQSARAVDVDVVADDQGLLQFVLDHGSLENTEYASFEDGQLRLHFNSDADLSNGGFAGQGDGLNPDSTFDFDNLFQIRNATADDLAVDVDKSGLDNPDDITFYAHFTNGSLIGTRDSDWNGQINAGFGVNIGVRIETPDNVDPGWESGEIVIEAEDPDDLNV